MILRKVFSSGNELIRGECDGQIGSHGRNYIYLSTGVILTVMLSCQEFPSEGGQKGDQNRGRPENGAPLTTFPVWGGSVGVPTESPQQGNPPRHPQGDAES